MTAALLSLAIAQWLAPGAASAVLAVVLSLSLWRSHLERDRKGRIEAAFALPLVALASIGVGLLLRDKPWLGALLFVAGMFLSIWLRRFGSTTARAGRLIALPFVVLLIAPHVPAARGWLPAWLVPIAIALLALACVTLCHAVAMRIGWLPKAAAQHIVANAQQNAAPRREGAMRPIASTRMALQMAAALAAAFVIGYLWFPQRWSWIVLTAFIVVSGNSGRVDVVHKALLRIVGAAAGTLVAFAFAGHVGTSGAATTALILAAVFLGTWLRPLNYAWWALFATIALALLQAYGAAPATDALHRLWWLRLEEIAIGAALGIAACWFVFPVPSQVVLRRRVADALAALSQALDPAQPDANAAAFDAQLQRIARMAPGLRLARAVVRRGASVQPADWIDALFACRTPALALVAMRHTPGAVRRAVGDARKAMIDPQAILPALLQLRTALAAAASELEPRAHAPHQETGDPSQQQPAN